jgi:hypothetical protein
MVRIIEKLEMVDGLSGLANPGRGTEALHHLDYFSPAWKYFKEPFPETVATSIMDLVQRI